MPDYNNRFQLSYCVRDGGFHIQIRGGGVYCNRLCAIIRINTI